VKRHIIDLLLHAFTAHIERLTHVLRVTVDSFQVVEVTKIVQTVIKRVCALEGLLPFEVQFGANSPRDAFVQQFELFFGLEDDGPLFGSFGLVNSVLADFVDQVLAGIETDLFADQSGEGGFGSL